MSNFRRARTSGGTFFFTVVTYQRQRFLTKEPIRAILRKTIEITRTEYPFIINAWVLLPDHLHCIWTLPDSDHDYSKRWGIIKARFSKHVKTLIHPQQTGSSSRFKHRETSIWQRRFWEHQICNEEDYRNHMDYIHYNPVKHGLVSNVSGWPYSTFHRYVQQGTYPKDWGNKIQLPNNEYGE